MSCEHCSAGVELLKMKRRYMHYVGFRLVPCVDKNYEAKPGDWAETRPRQWEPKHLSRYQRKLDHDRENK